MYVNLQLFKLFNMHIFTFFVVFNSRLKHSYATIMPTTKSKSSSFDTLNDVSSDTLDGYSLKSLSTQLSYGM